MEEINLIELTGSNIHPALEKMEYDGWTLQFSGGGSSRRSNSILPLEKGTVSLEEKVTECEKLYAAHNLPCTFKMTEAAPEGLYEFLKNHNYSYEAETDVMTVIPTNSKLNERFESIIEPEETGIIMTSEPDEAWLDCFFKWENRTDPNVIEINRKQFELVGKSTNLNAVYCRVQMSGKDVAVASAVMENGMLFLLNVIVDEAVRGKGYGKILVKEILEAACNSMGAEKLCLQVVASNEKAIKLYKSFGFEFIYKYWYMVK